MKPDPTPEPRPVKRTLFVQVDDPLEGTREIFDPDPELMAELGWIRSEQFTETLTAAMKLGEEQTVAMAVGMGAALKAEMALNGNGVNGHAIPDLVDPMTPLELADRIPLSGLVNDYRAQHFPPNARNSGDIALELVASLIRVLEGERKAGA